MVRALAGLGQSLLLDQHLSLQPRKGMHAKYHW